MTSADVGAVHDALVAAVGAAVVSDRPLDRLAYGHDTWPVALKAPADTRWQPDLVAWPGSTEDVAAIVRIAADARMPVVPVGGLSGIVGGALAVRGGIALDMLRMNRVLDIDPISGLVRVQAGIIGTNLEDALAAQGLTTGHLPQSSRSSTVGGWIAHRAAGVASTRYGKIETIVRGMRVVLADGTVLDTSTAPASATGPMLHSLFFGVEGTLGIVVEATLTVQPIPEDRRWAAYAFVPEGTRTGEPGMDDAAFLRVLEVIRRVMRRGYRPAIVRAYDPAEAGPLLDRAGWAGHGRPGTPALLMVGAEGEAPQVTAELAAVASEAAGGGGVELGSDLGEAWAAHRFDTSWLVSSVRAPGSMGDALEVAASWRQLPGVYVAMRAALQGACAPDGVVLGHLSHAYPDGGNLYLSLPHQRRLG